MWKYKSVPSRLSAGITNQNGEPAIQRVAERGKEEEEKGEK